MDWEFNAVCFMPFECLWIGHDQKTEKQILQESWFNQGQVFEWCVPQETNGPTSIKSLILSKDNISLKHKIVAIGGKIMFHLLVWSLDQYDHNAWISEQLF